MSTSAIIRIQENLQYPPLKKIDPNTQQITVLEGETEEHTFSQAAIPSILAAFYRFVQTNEGATAFLKKQQPNGWQATLFGEKMEEAIQHISAYSGETYEFTFLKTQAIAEETVDVIFQLLPANALPQDVKDFFKNEKNHILLYLPPELQMGTLLDNDALDDQSHKMEGIVSTLMHNIGNAFDTTKQKENIMEPFEK
jgi:hypothetical protein